MNFTRKDTHDGAAFVVGYDEGDISDSIKSKLAGDTETPTPRGSAGSRDGGAVRRFTDRFSQIGIGGLRSVSLQGHEIVDAVRTRRDELYRNEFPLIRPRFVHKCTACGSEFDTEREQCSACGNSDLRRPDPAEKRAAETLFESVNKEGQSLRDVAKHAEPDQWLAGVSTLVIRYEYAIATEGQFVDPGTIIDREPIEITRADPHRLVPVVDADGRVGGHQWACPLHRDDSGTATEPGACPQCGAELREVFFIEQHHDQDRYYFRDEVVTWAFPFPRLNGLDGLAPAAAVWVRQAILDMMDRYGAAYFDPDSDRLPKQFMILHTTNPDHWEEELRKARDDEDPYDSPIFTNQYSPRDSSVPEVDVVDAMPDELLGQNQAIKSDYKSDIRQAFGVSDVHDSDLEDASGLNNEGLQLEVTDRSIASQQHDYVEGWLDTLAKRVGLTDWRIEFLPSTGPDAADLQDEVRAGAMADKAGLDARYEDGSVEIADGAFEAGADTQLPGATGSQPVGGGGGGPLGPDTLDPPDTPADQKARVGDIDQCGAAVDVLERAYRHIVWASDVDQKAAPFFNDDEDLPEFVTELVQQAINEGAIHTAFESISASARARLSDVLSETLQQPQGWSLRSIADSLQEEFALDEVEAETIARAETKAINDRAREIGYERQGSADEAQFKFLGPIDDRKETSCLWLIGGDSLAGTSTGFEGTNPDYGGEPVTLDRLRDLVQEANNRFVDGHDARRYAPHIGCRDSYVQHYN
jgi:ribosomal protein L37E